MIFDRGQSYGFMSLTRFGLSHEGILKKDSVVELNAMSTVMEENILLSDEAY